MWRVGLDPKRLEEAAKTLGADVPYFLVGGPALGLGRGDEIHPITLPLDYRVLVVQGAGAVSTAAVFGTFAKLGRKGGPRSRIDRFLRGTESLDSLRNDLEPAALAVSPTLARVGRLVRRAARDTGASKAAMSGSGSSFFLLFDDVAARRAARASLEESGLRAEPCAFLTRKAFLNRFEV
jgi:4-diphosphocytidyl-2-C-methyl-D-erythritol kinase